MKNSKALISNQKKTPDKSQITTLTNMKNLPQNTPKSPPYEPLQLNSLPHTEPSREKNEP